MTRYAYGNNMPMKCLRNDTIMIWHMNDEYIYICCNTIWKWYDICSGTMYVINWYVYVMVYCDTICYGMICIWWKFLCLEIWKRYDMAYVCKMIDMMWLTCKTTN